MTEDTTIHISRVVDAPAERIFDAWTTADGLASWYAPGEDWETVVSEVDPRPGGSYRISFSRPGGPSCTESGTYGTVDRPHRLAYTMDFESSDGSTFSTLVTVTFHDRGGRTEVEIVEEAYPSAEIAEHHRLGWSRFLDRLERATTAVPIPDA